MLIAHGPAGYLVGTAAARVKQRPELVIAGLMGGFFPDFDALGYHLGVVQGFHRATPLHWPSIWIALTVIGIMLMLVNRRAGDFLTVFALAGLVHCGLDATMAPLYWAAPFYWQTFELIHVPGGWSPYWLGFIFYWTFLPEITIWIAAIWVWKSRAKKGGTYEQTAAV